MTIKFISNRDQWGGLSNFAPVYVYHEGAFYKSVEHAYQASKTLDFGEKGIILGARTASEAKKLGKTLTLRPDWDLVKVSFMRQLLLDKFHQSPYYELLLSTLNEDIEEDAPWDEFWGTGRKGTGQNMLGKLLVKVREEIRNPLAVYEENYATIFGREPF